MHSQRQTDPTPPNPADFRHSVDDAEVAQFSRIADEWWDATGKFKPLHEINPLRIGYIRELAVRHFRHDETAKAPLAGLRLLDIGCGGGLIAEPMARLGAAVVGADASEKNIAVAGLHANASGLSIDYRTTTAEALAAAGERFDVVLALEIVEHVTDPVAFIASCAALLNPGGLLIMSTLNRTRKSFLMAIVGAEYVLRLLPRGTHQWHKFVTPDEMQHAMEQAGLRVVDRRGMVLNPLRWQWKLSATDMDVNYLMAAAR